MIYVIILQELHRESKNKTLNSCQELTQILTDFIFFDGRFNGKFATKSDINIPPHFKYVATLPCELWMSENWQQSEICIAINDKSQSTVAKHLSYDTWLHY